ncbi:MAG TPA: hypothetical protein VMS22_07910 [Candidatus Eisenbacteria bacterium]|nr:hypothetical protein [Candidatus Eisenbacteria bacterium]
MRTMLGVVLALSVLAAGTAAAAETQCTYNHVFYNNGSTTCQNGTQTVCAAGTWKPTGERCADNPGDPTGEETKPGVNAPRVREPRVGEPSAGAVPTPRVPPINNGGSGW